MYDTFNQSDNSLVNSKAGYRAINNDLAFMIQFGFVISIQKYESLFNLWKCLERQTQ
jgi:hypothetical protein